MRIHPGKLSGDAFIINAVSADDNGAAVNVQTVLQNGETSPVISINKQTTLNISRGIAQRIQPLLSKCRAEAGNGNQAYGYSWRTCRDYRTHGSGKHYFHVSDA